MREEQRRAALLDRPVGDLGDLEVRVDLGLDRDQLALPSEQVDPGAEIGGRHRFRVYPAARSNPAREGRAEPAASGCGRAGS